MEEETNNLEKLTPEEIIRTNYPTRLTRLQKEHKCLDVFGELNDWSSWITTWSKEIKKELTSNPEALYLLFKKQLKKAKPKLFK